MRYQFTKILIKMNQTQFEMITFLLSLILKSVSTEYAEYGTHNGTHNETTGVVYENGTTENGETAGVIAYTHTNIGFVLCG